MVTSKNFLLMGSAVFGRCPLHLKPPVAIFVGDHDPAHALGLAFRVPCERTGTGIFVVDHARELGRRHRHGLRESSDRGHCGFVVSSFL
jgi:hypothetical protein